MSASPLDDLLTPAEREAQARVEEARRALARAEWSLLCITNAEGRKRLQRKRERVQDARPGEPCEARR